MWPSPQQTADSVTFTQGIHNGKLQFLCSVTAWCQLKDHTYLSKAATWNMLSAEDLFK